MLGNIQVSIPVYTDAKKTLAYPVLDRGLNYTVSQESMLEKYNQYKKVARYIVEYAFWLLSGYVQRTGRELNLITLQDFLYNHVKVVEGFEYGYVPKTFAMDSGVMDNDHLVVTSKEAFEASGIYSAS